MVAVLLLMPSGVARQVSGGSTPARAVWGTPYLQVDLDQLIRDVPVDRAGVRRICLRRSRASARRREIESDGMHQGQGIAMRRFALPQPIVKRQLTFH